MYGKRKCILYANFFVFVGGSLTVIKNIPCIIAGRFLYGLACGSFSCTVPGFINELSPIEMKGPLGTFTQILICSGIMIANFMGLPIPDLSDPSGVDTSSFLVQDYWRVVFGVPILMGLI